MNIAVPDPELSLHVPPYPASIAQSQSTRYFLYYHINPPQMAQISTGLLSPQLANLVRLLIDYYDKTVCSSIVAFDGPTNPHRTHNLRLTFHNDALMSMFSQVATFSRNIKRRYLTQPAKVFFKTLVAVTHISTVWKLLVICPQDRLRPTRRGCLFRPSAQRCPHQTINWQTVPSQ